MYFKRKRNFTLVEVMIAVFIVSVSSVAIYSVMMASKTSLFASRLHLEGQRYSYDVAMDIWRSSKSDLESKYNLEKVNSFNIKDSSDYFVSSKSLSSEKATDLTTDLRKYGGQVEVAFSKLLNPDTNSSNQENIGYRVDVTVRWSYRAPMSYTTTVYKYFTD